MRSYYPIDWKRIANAIEFYQSYGYTYVELPYVVPNLISRITAESGIVSINADLGDGGTDLVGSAEQSFLHLALNGNLDLTKRYVGCTPCFRNEVLDDLHQKHFMKVELFVPFMELSGTVTRPIAATVINVAIDAKLFFRQYAEVDVVPIDDTCDIMLNGIEIGSYGFRRVRDISGRGLSWVYGTGLAEPRFSQALAKS